MEVILMEDVKALGKKGQIVKVNDGYARNFILPKRLGIEANAKNLRDLEAKKAAEAQHQKELLDEARELGEKLKTVSVTLRIKVGENGKVFGSVSSKEITAVLLEQQNLEIDKKKLQLAEPIKNVGEYDVPVKLHPQVTVSIKVKVEGE